MKQMQLLPVPVHARPFLPPPRPAWQSQTTLASIVGSKLNTAKYRKLLAVLNGMDELRRVAQVSGAERLEHSVTDLLSEFERDDKGHVLEQGKRKKPVLDQYGRSYTLGRRKTSSARVWIIPTKRPYLADSKYSPGMVQEAGVFGEIPVITSKILINSVPINLYFAQPRDRERIVRPLKLAGLLGAYNVFCLVRGGGKSGQSGAVAHGIAKGLAIHETTVQGILKKAKLMRRDPRMVERKKTGRAKARKAYQWVKR